MLRIVFFIVFLFGFSSLQAAGYYQIEVIIFRIINVAPAQEEAWPSNPASPNIKKAIELTPATTQTAAEPVPYQLLDSSSYLLRSQANALSLSKDYRLIAHLAWQQPLDKAIPVHIFGGEAYNSDGNVIPHPSVLPPENTNSQPTEDRPSESGDSGIMTAQVMPSAWEFNGTITPAKSNNGANIAVNLLLTLPHINLPTSEEQNSPFSSFLLQQTINLKNNQLGYIDHPYFGILILVKKLS